MRRNIDSEFSEKELGLLLGVAPRHIANIQRRALEKTIVGLRKVARELNINPDNLDQREEWLDIVRTFLELLTRKNDRSQLRRPDQRSPLKPKSCRAL